MKPTVSVIVPAYNASRTVGATIESVLSQSFTDLELVMVDDGSTDETKDIVSEYKSKDPRIVYAWQKNSGVSAARNRGLDIAKGKHISIIDADDLWEKDKLNRQLAVIGSEKDMVVLTGIRRFQLVNGRKVYGEITMPPPLQNDRYDLMSTLLLSSFQMVLINTALLEKNLARKLGGWNPNMRIAEDWDFWIRASRRCRFKVIEEPLSYYRKHAESVTKNLDLFMVLDAHRNIIKSQLKQGVITKEEFERALISRQVETCGFFIYQGEVAKAIHVLSKSLGSMQGWTNRNVWTRGTEIFRLAFRKVRNAYNL